MAEVKAIATRNTFAATLKSVPLQVRVIADREDPTAIAVATMVLRDVDRIVATVSAADAPEWVARELEHGNWASIVADVDQLRDAFSGRTLTDLRTDTNATERAVKRLTGAHKSAQKVLDRNTAAHAAYDALPGARSGRKS